MTHRLFSIALAALLTSGLAQAQSLDHDHGTTPAAAAAEFTLGEVRKIDLAQGKLTIRHEEIKNLQMPPMTMVFGIAQSLLPQGLKVGDKVRFRAAQENGQYRLTALQSAP